MNLFMDASALVAILTTEPDFQQYSDRAGEADQLFTSAIAKWETIRALTRERRFTTEAAAGQLKELLDQFSVRIVSIGETEAGIAIEAHHRYGKSNHGARLNMGDCFAYACAKANDAELLYKGDDFAKTDLA